MSKTARLRAPQGIQALILFVLMTPALFAFQTESEGEVSAFGGGTFGLGTHPSVGGSTGLQFSKYGIALVETVFTPMGEDTLRKRTGEPASSSRLYDFNTSFHIQVPVREKIVPYGIVGIGLLFDSFKAATGPNGAVVGFDEFNFAFHTGGGVRYHVTENWGIRPEFKVIVSHRTFTRLTVGVFYKLPPGWPW